MKNQNFKSLSKKGTRIIVESSTNDGGKTNNPHGWWGARTSDGKNIPHSVFKKIVNNCKYEVIYGGFSDGKLISTITEIEILK